MRDANGDGDDQFHISHPDLGTVFIDCFGGRTRKISINEEVIYFSWSDRFGPIPETKTGRSLDLSWRHPFWRSVSLWNLQGRREEDGICIWHEPKKPVLRHLGGRNYKIIEDGEEGYDW